MDEPEVKKMFKNLTVAKSLALSFGTLIALLLAVAVMALWSMGNMRASTVEINTNWLPSVERVNKMNTNTSDFRIAQFQHVLNTDEKAMGAIEKSLSEVLALFEENRKAYQALISSDEERKLYDAFADEWKQYLRVHDEILALSRKNENDKAKALLEGSAKELFVSFSAKLDKLVDLNHNGATAEGEKSDKTYAAARWPCPCPT